MGGKEILPDYSEGDPAGAPDEGDIFEEAFQSLSRRMGAFLSLPLEALEPAQLESELSRIPSLPT